MRNIKLIALDLDGTLLNMEKKVPQGNYQALKECEKAGIQSVPATGRGVGGIPPMIRELPGANYAITTNGAVVADLKNNKAIKTCGLSNEMIQRILNIAKKYHSATDPFIDGRAITEPASIDHMDEFGLSPEMQKLIRDTREVVPNVMEYVKTTGAEAEKVNIFMADLEEREVLRKELMRSLSCLSALLCTIIWRLMQRALTRAPLFYGLQTILALTGKKPCHLETGKMISL